MGPLNCQKKTTIQLSNFIIDLSCSQQNNTNAMTYNTKLQIQTEMSWLKQWTTFIFLFVLTIWVSKASTPTSLQRIQWGIYNWVQNQILINQPLKQNMIGLSHPGFPYLFVQVSFGIAKGDHIKQVYNVYNASQYHVGKDGIVDIVTKEGSIGIRANKVKSVKVSINCLRQQCKQNKITLDNQLQSISQNTQCIYQSDHIICNPTSQLALSLPMFSGTVPTVSSPQTEFKQFQSSLLSFSQIYSIAGTTTNLDILTFAISETMNSICVYRPINDEDFYLGFCEQIQKDKNGKNQGKDGKSHKWGYDFRFSPFTMFLLADFSYGLAEAIYHHFFDLFQTTLLYNLNGDQQIVPMPEHIEVFTRFGSVLQLQNQVELLNSMFVKPMLSQLGTLHQQLNYRQAKKLHPLLLKMLRQKWSSQTKLDSYKSIYTESFTPDFRYHEYGEQLQQSLTKLSYIYKIVDTFTSLQIKFKSLFMPVEQIKEHLQEHFTLLNIMRVYVSDDAAAAKTGKYRDIIDVGGNLQLYGKYVGYEAILPYVYGLGKSYPQAAIKQLQCQHGLKSSNQQQLPSTKKHNFRGDIHSYFNLKILTGVVYKFQQDKTIPQTRRKQVISHMQKIGTSIGKKVLKDYKESKQIYTSWNQDGKGKGKNGWGKIVTALFLRFV